MKSGNLVATMVIATCLQACATSRRLVEGFNQDQQEKSFSENNEHFAMAQYTNCLRFRHPECSDEVATALVAPLRVKISDDCAKHFIGYQVYRAEAKRSLDENGSWPREICR